MTGDVPALGTVAGVLQRHVSHWISAGGEWSADCLASDCEWHERGIGGSTSAVEAHTAHVAAEVVKALGAETRVEWRQICGHGASPAVDYEPSTRATCNQIARRDRRAVTTFPPLVGEWTEVPSTEGDA